MVLFAWYVTQSQKNNLTRLLEWLSIFTKPCTGPLKRDSARLAYPEISFYVYSGN